MNNNNNFSVLPFYCDINEQFHRLPYSYGAFYSLYCPLGELLPFQIQRAHAASQPVTEVMLIRVSDGTMTDITQQVVETGLQVVEFAAQDEDVIVYNAVMPLTLPQGMRAVGRYYLRVTDGVNVWYSDVFTWTDAGNLLRIQWYDEENLITDSGIIVYRDPRFINNLYLCTEVGKPEYQFTEEGETRDGYYFPEKQLSEKTYKATILAPEYLCDVMRLIRMADHIRITDTYGRIYDCDTFQLDVKWEEQGDLASVVMEWQTDSVVKKVGVAYVRRMAGDYNIDYNDDYDNEQ